MPCFLASESPLHCSAFHGFLFHLWFLWPNFRHSRSHMVHLILPMHPSHPVYDPNGRQDEQDCQESMASARVSAERKSLDKEFRKRLSFALFHSRRECGPSYPVMTRKPIKARRLGYKSLKHVNQITVTDRQSDVEDGTGASYVKLGYSWSAGIWSWTERNGGSRAGSFFR